MKLCLLQDQASPVVSSRKSTDPSLHSQKPCSQSWVLLQFFFSWNKQETVFFLVIIFLDSVDFFFFLIHLMQQPSQKGETNCVLLKRRMKERSGWTSHFPHLRASFSKLPIWTHVCRSCCVSLKDMLLEQKSQNNTFSLKLTASATVILALEVTFWIQIHILLYIQILSVFHSRSEILKFTVRSLKENKLYGLQRFFEDHFQIIWKW